MASYCASKTAAFVAAVTASASESSGVAVMHAWTEADQALWAWVLNSGSSAACLIGSVRDRGAVISQ